MLWRDNEFDALHRAAHTYIVKQRLPGMFAIFAVRLFLKDSHAGS